MAAHDLHRRGVRLRRVRPVNRERSGRAQRRPETLWLRWVVVRIRDPGVARVRLTCLVFAGGWHVVDLLERAPDPLRTARRLDRDMETDQRDVALRADDMPRCEGLGDVDDLGALDIGARASGRWIRGSQRPPGRLDRDRPDGEARRMARIRKVEPAAPAVGGERFEFGGVEMDLVAGVGAVLRDERIGRLADGEARLVEVGERRKRGDRLLPIVDAGPAWVAPAVARPGRGRDAAPFGVKLEQLVIGLERFPYPPAGVAERISRDPARLVRKPLAPRAS